MTSLEGYRFLITSCFERSYRDVCKKHYKKDTRGRGELDELVGVFLSSIKQDYKHPQSSLEPWPNKTHQEPWELWKLRFTMPRQSGSSSYGRLIYCVDPVDRWVKLMLLYTHAEYEGRPSDQQIREAFHEEVEPPHHADPPPSTEPSS